MQGVCNAAAYYYNRYGVDLILEIYILIGLQLISLIALAAILGGYNNKTTKIITESIESLKQQLNQRDDLIYILIGLQLISLIALAAILGGYNNKTTKIITESIESLKQQLNQRDDLILQILSEKLSYSQELIDSKLMSITAQNKNTLEQTATTVSDKLEGMQRTITTVLEAIRAS